MSDGVDELDPRRYGRRRPVSRRVVLLCGVGLVAAGSSVAATQGFGGQGASPAVDRRPPEVATGEVTRATLVDYKDVEGDLGFGEVSTLGYTPPGAGDGDPPTPTPPATPFPARGRKLITWLPPVDSEVRRGDPLLKVDEMPVVLLLGALPLYRDLAPGVSGPDVKQLKENLASLGYRVGARGETFTEGTAAVVRRWQKAIGQPVTGTVVPGQVVYLSGAIRVREHKRKVGDAATGEMYSYTGLTRTVTATLAEADRWLATVGKTVTVTAPGGIAVAGKVAKVGVPTADPADPDTGRKTEVTISVTDRSKLGEAPTGPVRVRFVVAERRDVLTVPVVALLARSGGGYAVRVIDGDTAPRVVPVQTGMFAEGRVEVRTDELRPGMMVEVPR